MQLLAGTLATFLVLVPGTAWADGSGSATATPTLPPQLQQAIDQLSVSNPCSKAIQADLEKTLTDIPALATEVLAALQSLGSDHDPAAFLTAVENALGIGDISSSGDTSTSSGDTSTSTSTSATTSSPDLPADLQQLVKDLQLCLSSGITIPTTTAAPRSSSAPVLAAAATSPPSGPVSYPGYAATGAVAPASFEHTTGTAPLLALGVGLLLVSAGAVTAGVRFRARRAGR